MSLSPEWQLLLACARTHLTDEDLRHLEQELIRPNLDWDRVAERACRHGVAPLIYRNVRRVCESNVLSQAVLDILKGDYYRTAVTNTLLYRELREVLQALKEIGSEVIVLKGAVLAEAVYHDRALRPMRDIDLLVRKAELSRVEDRLSGLGYFLYKSRREKEFLPEDHYHWVFISVRRPPRNSLEP